MARPGRALGKRTRNGRRPPGTDGPRPRGGGKRDRSLAAYHQYEIGSAAFQVGIVLASASVITGVGLLAVAGGLLGVVGVAFSLLGAFAPTLVHF